jgi:hypothetical protein
MRAVLFFRYVLGNGTGCGVVVRERRSDVSTMHTGARTVHVWRSKDTRYMPIFSSLVSASVPTTYLDGWCLYLCLRCSLACVSLSVSQTHAAAGW